MIIIKMEEIRNNFENGLKLIREMDKIFERWKKVKDYDNYSVSSFGRVRNDKTNRILKYGTDGDGYYYVNLSVNGKAKNISVHKLVANTFLTNPLNKRCIDHIDHDRTNNHINNLRFATHSENNRNANKKKSNTTGFIGVSYDKTVGEYKARYSLNGKQKHIGYYETAEEASESYQAKIKEHYKEFANI